MPQKDNNGSHCFQMKMSACEDMKVHVGDVICLLHVRPGPLIFFPSILAHL